MGTVRRLGQLVRRFRRANWAVADQAVISLGNFVCVYLLARSLPIEDFGIFTLMFTGLTAAGGLQNALISQPHNVIGAKLEGVGYRAFTSALALFQCALALGVGLLLSVTGLVLAAAWGAAVGGTLIALGLTAMPWLMQEFVRRTFYTRSHSRAAFMNDLVCYGSQVLGVALLLNQGALTTESALLAICAASVLATALGAWQLRAYVRFEASVFAPSSLAAVWRRSWGFGRWMTAKSVVEWFGTYGHTWLLAGMLGTGVLGVYRAAYHLVNVLNPVSMAVQAYIPSRASAVFARGGTAELATWMKRNFLLAGSLYSLIVFGLIALSGQMLTWFYGDRFAAFSPYLEWVIVLSALEKLVRKFKHFPSTVLLVMERTRTLFLFDLVSILLLLVAAVTLIGSFGMLGAPLAKLIVATVMLAVFAVQARALTVERAPTDFPVAQEPRA